MFKYIAHTRGPILEETHYYPFGLTMKGISNKASTIAPTNKRKFNDGTEFSNEEFLDRSGLEVYETPFRSYDPQIGRFLQTDLMASDYESWSPYNYTENNPLLLNDPSGLDPETSTPSKPKELDEVVITVSRKNNWNYSDWSYFVDKNKKWGWKSLKDHLKQDGVSQRGLDLFTKAWNGIAYREKKDEYDDAAWEIEGALARELTTFLAGGLIINGIVRGVGWGLRGYKVYKRVRLLEKSRKLGAASEEIVGVGAKIRIPSLSNTANYRIPDRLTATTIEDVKSVKYLSYTQQIKDFHLYAQQNSLQMILHVRATTKFSAPLQNLISKSEIILKTIPK